ncbi:hypothetical protein LPB41_01455 [Thalassospira sp. MA62]|nr:hypothetical protein [Thalassospira sp. MA62]
MSQQRQSVIPVNDLHASLSAATAGRLFASSNDDGMLPVLINAISDLVAEATARVPSTVDQLSVLLGAIISRHFGAHLFDVAQQDSGTGQYEYFQAQDAKRLRDEKACCVWLALTILDGEAMRIAMTRNLAWPTGQLADQYCPNPPSVKQVLGCRELSLSEDLAKLYAIAQQMHGGLDRFLRRKATGQDILPASASARLSACFPSYIRDFNGVVTLPMVHRLPALPGRGDKQQTPDPSARRKGGLFRRMMMVAATVLVCLVGGFLLGWVYQGQVIEKAILTDSLQVTS